MTDFKTLVVDIMQQEGTVRGNVYHVTNAGPRLVDVVKCNDMDDVVRRALGRNEGIDRVSLPGMLMPLNKHPELTMLETYMQEVKRV